MPMTTYPLNNILYTAEDVELYHCTRTSGVYAKNSFGYSISGSDNTIVIGTGLAWINNKEFSGKASAQKFPESYDLGVSDPNYPRIDAVVIQFDANKNGAEIVIKKGTAASNPIPPSVVRTESVYELHLYHVRRNAGSLSISASDITDLRLNSNYCGIMADSVTHVDTDAIDAQISELIERLKAEIESVDDGSAYWLKSDVIPIKNGGTGARTAEEALANLGAVGISKFKNLAYSQTDARGEIANTTISAYPTTPGVFRVGDNNATLGIPESRGTLIIFDGGGFIGHIFVNLNGLWFSRTDGTYTVTAWNRVQDWLFSDSNGTFVDKYGRNWNPEFVFGAEYITEERWNNSGVYKKWLNLGKLGTAGSTISVAHGITRTWITGVRGIAVIPGGSALEMVNGGSNGSVFVSDDKIQWHCSIDLSSYNGYVEITYTKV